MEFKITKKPVDIDTDSRILYLTVIILLIIFNTGTGKNKTISLLKIHLLLWTIKKHERQERLLKSLDNDCLLSIGFWDIDLKNNSVLTFLINDELCGFNGKKYYLTVSGFALVKKIKDLEIMKEEHDFLKVIGKRLTDKNVEKLKSLWS